MEVSSRSFPFWRQKSSREPVSQLQTQHEGVKLAHWCLEGNQPKLRINRNLAEPLLCVCVCPPTNESVQPLHLWEELWLIPPYKTEKFGNGGSAQI